MLYKLALFTLNIKTHYYNICSYSVFNICSDVRCKISRIKSCWPPKVGGGHSPTHLEITPLLCMLLFLESEIRPAERQRLKRVDQCKSNIGSEDFLNFFKNTMDPGLHGQ